MQSAEAYWCPRQRCLVPRAKCRGCQIPLRACWHHLEKEEREQAKEAAAMWNDAVVSCDNMPYAQVADLLQTKNMTHCLDCRTTAKCH